MMRKHVLKWELSGIAFVFLLGALLYFAFEWSGESSIVALFASVNESVWEHFKQGFWTMCLYAAIGYRFLRRYTASFLTARGVAIYLIPIISGMVFYGIPLQSVRRY
jgi:succinate dehydrogenase hydrophobic anchor subunit